MGPGWYRRGTSVVPGWSGVVPDGTGATRDVALTRRDDGRNWVRTLEMKLSWCWVLRFGVVTGPPAALIAGCLEVRTHERDFVAHKMADMGDAEGRRPGAVKLGDWLSR